MILDYSAVSGLAKGALKQHVERTQVPLNEVRLLDLVFFKNNVLLPGNGVYVLSHKDEILYVGKAGSRSFIERIPAHFDPRPTAWMNTFLRHYAKGMCGGDYDKALRSIAESCSIFLVDTGSTKEKSAAVEWAMVQMLNPRLNHSPKINRRVSQQLAGNPNLTLEDIVHLR